MRFKISIPFKWLIAVLSMAILLLLLKFNLERTQFTGLSGSGFKFGISIGIRDLVILVLLTVLVGTALLVRFVRRKRTNL